MVMYNYSIFPSDIPCLFPLHLWLKMLASTNFLADSLGCACGLPNRDYRYYLNALEEAKYQVDHEALREYFPFDTVLEGMLSIYRDAFGLQFTELKDTEIWHPDVLVYQVCKKKYEIPSLIQYERPSNLSLHHQITWHPLITLDRFSSQTCLLLNPIG